MADAARAICSAGHAVDATLSLIVIDGCVLMRAKRAIDFLTHIAHPLPTLTPVGIVFCTRSSQGERENCLSRKGEEGARRPQIL